LQRRRQPRPQAHHLLLIESALRGQMLQQQLAHRCLGIGGVGSASQHQHPAVKRGQQPLGRGPMQVKTAIDAVQPQGGRLRARQAQRSGLLLGAYRIVGLPGALKKSLRRHQQDRLTRRQAIQRLGPAQPARIQPPLRARRPRRRSHAGAGFKRLARHQRQGGPPRGRQGGKGQHQSAQAPGQSLRG
jgi:hypothetical protein